MKLEITRQRNEANEVSIDMDIIIHETVGNPKKKYQLSGYINFQDYDAQTIGIILLWLSAALTLFTGYDYMRKGIDHAMSEDNKD